MEVPAELKRLLDAAYVRGRALEQLERLDGMVSTMNRRAEAALTDTGSAILDKVFSSFKPAIMAAVEAEWVADRRRLEALVAGDKETVDAAVAALPSPKEK